MTQEIINTLQMLVNENDSDMRTHYAVAINNYILELEKPKTCDGCIYNVFGSGSDGMAVDCNVGMHCNRVIPDKYKPKG